jgi:uncharacterized protein
VSSITDFIAEHPVVDVHEHHIPELVKSDDVDLLKLFQQSYAGWTQERPYPLPSESREGDPMLEASNPTTWAKIRPYLEESGSSMFVRNLLQGIHSLYEVPKSGINESTWESIDRQILKNHGTDSWHDHVLAKARIEHVITDSYSDPLLDARKTFGAHYSSVVRMNAFALGWHPDSRDHNGNSAHELLAQLNLSAETFEQYLESIEEMVRTMPIRNQVAIKNALAYDRSIDFSQSTKAEAKSIWGRSHPSAEDQKKFGDFIVDHFCSLCAAHQIPMQMHLGTAIIRGSHPMNVAPLIERHPKTKFLLMHLAYPWSRDLLGMAFVYRNIWLDLTWAALLSPSHFKLAFHEAIEVLPDDSRMMFGGDNWHAEETFGTIKTFKRLIGEALDEKIANGYFDLDHGRRLASRILKQNAIDFFKLPSSG